MARANIFSMLLIHSLTRMCVAGKLYILSTGANEFRWDKMKDKLKIVVQSFDVVDRF